MTRKRLASLLVVVLPVVAMLVWTLSNARRRAVGATVEMRIEGFDPRDLLSGHFLQYRIDYGKQVAPCAGGITGPICVCLSVPAGEVFAEAQSASPCGEQDCAQFVRGTCEYSRFVANIERFYFSEQYTDALRVVPPNSSVVLKVDDEGRAVVETLKVDGRPLEEFLRGK